ncbi:hypothetical protein JCM24511_08825 [Saitozyma sp. JCM 24511]|nr:hypothetical protein JCM24511_08825 [Saitozyma sp. JCM 24511]
MMNTTVVPNSQTQATSGDKADIEMAEYTGEHGAVDEVKAGNVVPPSDFVNLNRLQTLRKFWKVTLFAFMVSFGATLDGFHQTIPGNIIANPGFIQQFGTVVGANGQLALDALHVSAWGGVLSGGNIFGNILGGFTADLFGRKFNMFLMTLLLMLATICEMVATEWRVWLASKLFAGIGNGFAQTALVIYNSEIAPPQIRGFLLSTWAFFYALGQLTASIGLQILATSPHPNDYKNSIYSEWVFTGIFLIFLVFLPESPWYHVRNRNHDKAKASLRTLYGNVEGYDVEHEYATFLSEVEFSERLRDEQKQAKWSEIFTGINGRRFMITAAIPLYGQLVGGSLIFTYLTYFFQLAGLENPFLASLIVFILLLAFIAVSFYTTDLVGRRPLLLGAIVVVVICLLGVGIAGSVPETPSSKNALIALACIWVVAYASGIAPCGSIYQGEASAPRLRAKTNSLSQALGQSFGLIFNYTVPIMLSPQQANWGVKTGYFFAGTAFLGGIVLYFQMPEFKGRSYAELDELFQKKMPARKFRTTKTSHQLLAQGTDV